MKKKGFTLIELLAVIVILAIIVLITIPLLGNVIESAKKGALMSTANGIIESANIYYTNKIPDKTIIFTFENGKQTSTENLLYKGVVENGSLRLFSDGKTALCISNDKYSALKNVNDETIKITSGICTYNDITNEYEAKNQCNENLKECQSQKSELEQQITQLQQTKIDLEQQIETLKNEHKITVTNLGTLPIESRITGRAYVNVSSKLDDPSKYTVDNFFVKTLRGKASGQFLTDDSLGGIIGYDPTTGIITLYETGLLRISSVELVLVY